MDEDAQGRLRGRHSKDETTELPALQWRSRVGGWAFGWCGIWGSLCVPFISLLGPDPFCSFHCMSHDKGLELFEKTINWEVLLVWVLGVEEVQGGAGREVCIRVFCSGRIFSLGGKFWEVRGV